MMIYNLAQLLRTKFPTETFFVNARIGVAGADVPDRNTLLTEGAGPDDGRMKFGFQMAQLLSRDKNVYDAHLLAWTIYEYLHGHWGLVLPAVTVGVTLYPEIQTGQITATSKPQSLGEDEEGRSEFSTNYQIYWRRT